MIVCLDANVIIYYIERNPVWEPKVSARLKAIASAGDFLAASEAALLECLVGPFQSGDSATLTDYQKFFGARRATAPGDAGCLATRRSIASHVQL